MSGAGYTVTSRRTVTIAGTSSDRQERNVNATAASIGLLKSCEGIIQP